MVSGSLPCDVLDELSVQISLDSKAIKGSFVKPIILYYHGYTRQRAI